MNIGDKFNEDESLAHKQMIGYFLERNTRLLKVLPYVQLESMTDPRAHDPLPRDDA